MVMLYVDVLPIHDIKQYQTPVLSDRYYYNNFLTTRELLIY